MTWGSRNPAVLMELVKAHLVDFHTNSRDLPKRVLLELLPCLKLWQITGVQALLRDLSLQRISAGTRADRKSVV